MPQHIDWVKLGLGAWVVFKFLVDGVANSLEAPTAQSSDSYKFWFKMTNYVALNVNRAKNLSHIEDSPNWLPAAEGYFQKRVAELGITIPPPKI